MDNPEYTFQILEVFSKIKTKEIPRELEEYISYVARTGDPVFQWSLVKILIKEKLLAVLNEFKENNPSLEIPPCPNVDPFNYEAMRGNLLSRLDSFILPPFTIQRICELLSAPRKEYSRIDKYMRAIEKNVLVVSACELSLKRGLEADSSESMMNGMLYDKVNDSLNNFTNHVFSTTNESNVDDLHLSSKINVPESDTVQQILDESWTETADSDEFKMNETNDSSLSVSFDNELRFVTEKNSNNDKVNEAGETESKNIADNSSFDESESLLIEPSLQNMIADNANVHYDDDTLKSTSSLETTAIERTALGSKKEENVIFTFNDSTSQMDISSSAQGNSSLAPENENVSHTEKEAFDVASNVGDGSKGPEYDNKDNFVSCSDDHSFSKKIINKNTELEKQLQSEEQYETERSFEFADFSEIPSKNDNSGEYNFLPDSSKNQSTEIALQYADNLSDIVDAKNDNEEIQKVTFPRSDSTDNADNNLILFETIGATSNQMPDEVDLSQDKCDSKDTNDESLSCGDKEEPSRSTHMAECPKEPDLISRVHGEPELDKVADE